MSSGVQFLAVAALAAAATAAPSGGPGLARSENFEVYAQGGMADARAIVRSFERLHAYFAQQTGLRLNKHRRVRVIAFRSRQEYESYRLRPGAEAYYVGSESRDTIVMTAPADDDIHIAAHEYAHFVLRANGMTLPPWLNEGLSEVFSAVRMERRESARQPARWRVLRSQSWMSLEELVTLPPDSPLREQPAGAEIFYAESGALADMLRESPAYQPRFAELVAALTAGTPSDRALASTYSKSLEEIAADLRAWVEKRRIVPVLLPTAVSDGANGEIRAAGGMEWRSVLGDLLLAIGRFDQAEAAYEALAREDPANPDFPAALAAIALHKKDWAIARKDWQRALDLGVRDADTCYRYALLADAGGLPVGDIRGALERALKERPEFDNAHYMLAHLDNNAGRYESAVAHLRAMRAVAAERQFAYWSALSYALDELGRHDEAKAAAVEARERAMTSEERARALQLAEIADTEIAVRFTRDANGDSRLVTTRVPREEPDWNPFIEPGDRIHRIEGKLRIFACDSAIMNIVVETPTGSVKLAIADPSRVQMRKAPAEFTCGPQPGDAVRVVYAERDHRDGGADGVVRSMEFN